MNTRELTIFIFLVSLEVFAFGQVRFYNYHDKQHISIKETYSICKDREGFIWAATKAGILHIMNGNYQLHMRMYDNALSLIINEKVFITRITPPFWETWWSRFLLLIVVFGFLFFLLRMYILYNLKQRNAKDKIRFFTNTTHDIRTSLTLISASIEQMNKMPELSEKSHYFLHLVTEQCKRLDTVSTQLLDFEKVDKGKGQLFLMYTDIVKLIKDRVSLFVTLAAQKHAELIFLSDKESYLTITDKIKTEKIVDNLISNAIKCTLPEGKIEVSLQCEKQRWILKVKGEGLGRSEDPKRKLFKEFYRGENPVNSKMTGSGTGLLLVKKYVTLYGGKISLASKERKGSTFEITIPYLKAGEVNEAVFPLESEEANQQPMAEPSRAIAPLLSIKKGKRPHLLVVEDNECLRELVKVSFLEDYKVSEAREGVEAWDKIRKEMPDMIVSAIKMPGMDGFELCQLVKSTFETSHIPLILLTSLSEKTKILEGLGLGADDYVTKPFDISILRQRMHSILKNRLIVRDKVWKLIKREDEGEILLNNRRNDEFVRKAVEVVRNHINDREFNKNRFAIEMHVSPSLLYKKLKLLTDQSPTNFIKDIRLNYALELLRTHKYTVTEVSELCGFSSINYFSRTFKKHFNKLPSEI